MNKRLAPLVLGEAFAARWRQGAGTMPSRSVLRDTYSALTKLPNVFGVYVGYKTTQRKRRSTIALVCCVTRKAAPARLSPSARIPPYLILTHGSFRYRIRTDVIAFKPELRHAVSTVAGPGDDIQLNPTDHATAGIVIDKEPHGRFVTSAGHAFLNTSHAVLSSNAAQFQAVLAAPPVISDAADYALLGVAPPLAANLFEDTLPLVGPYYPVTKADLGLPLAVLTCRGAIRPLYCIGLRGQFTFPDGTTLRDLVLTHRYRSDQVTLRIGDSGAALVDYQLRAWGLLRGFHPTENIAFFHPVLSLLAAEHAAMA
jgi:hypothetical protein